jgi:hypothetical protein
VAEPIAEFVESLSIRMTGKKVSEFEAERSELFLQDLENGKFPVNRLFTMKEVARACKHYLIEWDWFDGDYHGIYEPGLRLTELELKALNGWKGHPFKVPVVRSMGGREWTEYHEVKAELKQVIRYLYVGPGSPPREKREPSRDGG